MGIDIYALNFLLGLKGQVRGEALCLGRQGFHAILYPEQRRAAQLAIEHSGADIDVGELSGPDGFSEPFLTYLGAARVRSLDFSDYEGAEIIHDLNKPIPQDWEDQFDFVLDGGTLEHVFNLPTAIANVKALLRTGGLFVSINAANNQLGHGLYQFSPELFWRTFDREQGFVIEKMQLVPLIEPFSPTDVQDIPGVRQEFGRTDHSTYLMMVARCLTKATASGEVHQGDYARIWDARRGSQDRCSSS